MWKSCNNSIFGQSLICELIIMSHGEEKTPNLPFIEDTTGLQPLLFTSNFERLLTH